MVLLMMLLLVSCSEAPAPEAAGSPTTDRGSASESSPEADESGDPAASDRADADDQASDEDGEEEAADAAAPGGDGGGDDDDGVFNDGGSEDDHSSALHPAAGRYLYDQTGYESFCQAATCERQDLPREQPVEVRLKEKAGGRALVVSEVTPSDNRMVRTTATFTRARSLVTNVYARFDYEGFTFENTYQPEPPVEALRFPLEDGRSWSGRWRDSTSGTYEVRVFGTEPVSVGGASVNAVKLQTVTEFSGEFEGTGLSVIWLDPASRAVVKAKGKIELNSAFGRYITEFSNQLTSGPGF